MTVSVKKNRNNIKDIMDKQRAKELDEIAMTVVNDFIFQIGITNVERSYLTSKIQEFTTEKERSV